VTVDPSPARRFTRSSELARLRAMRSALLPDGLPERPALELASCFLPADENVSGDFFVVGERGDATVFVLGDVVGRGLDAAMRASYVRTLLASIVRFEQDPARVLRLTNDALMNDRTDRSDFITAVCLTFNPIGREISWALAGHPPPLSLTDGSELAGGDPPGPPLGIADDFEAPLHEATLAPGDGVLLYTDGIVEARAGAAFYGEERLAEVVAASAGASPSDLVTLVREDVERFAGREFQDDVCMLALRVTGSRADGDAEEVCSPDLLSA
jgi:phosphoserine phosphatase RsbU/P